MPNYSLTQNLFTNRTTNGTSDGFVFDGGRLHTLISGTQDGAAVSFQVSYDNGISFHDYLIDGSTKYKQTCVGKASYIIEDASIQLRAVISDAGSNTNLTITILTFYGTSPTNRANIPS